MFWLDYVIYIYIYRRRGKYFFVGRLFQRRIVCFYVIKIDDSSTRLGVIMMTIYIYTYMISLLNCVYGKKLIALLL